MPKKVFIAATQQNDGKTTLSISLISLLQEKRARVGFIKPVGQRYVEYDGKKIDEDSVLIEEVFKTGSAIEDMSPIAIDRGFTRRYIDSPNPNSLRARIIKAYSGVSAGKDYVIIEGTGHAGVGSVFDLSNAVVANMLQSQVILVAPGGIGKPFDEIMLNMALFQKQNVELMGVVVNKVKKDYVETVKKYLTTALARQGIRLLGVIPFQPYLVGPSMGNLIEELKGEIISGEENLNNVITQVVVGTTSPNQIVGYVKPGALIITSGAKEDLILSAVTTTTVDENNEPTGIAGLIITGGVRPSQKVCDVVVRSKIPTILVKDDDYTTASKLRDLHIKIRPYDVKKIEIAKNLVKEYVNVDEILRLM